MQHGLRVLTPGSDERIEPNRILSEELPAGYVRQASREKVVSMIDRLEGQGAEGVILGGAQLRVLIHQHDVALPLFETTALHVEATLDYALRADAPNGQAVAGSVVGSG